MLMPYRWYAYAIALLSEKAWLASVWVSFQTSFCATDFTSKIIFRRPIPIVAAGTYPIKIVGRNTTGYSTTYDVNLTMP
jgi:hypothetical protein